MARPGGRGRARRAREGCPRCWPGSSGSTSSSAAVLEAHETARLLGGTRYRAFSPSDTCPDNNLVTSRGVRFVDFEWGCFRDVALDAAYFRVPFPGCEAASRCPPGWPTTMLEAWRNEIASVWPDLDEPAVLERRLLHAQLLWVWLCTWWLLPRIRERDRPIGPDATRSPRISSALGHYWRQMARCRRDGRPARHRRARRRGRRRARRSGSRTHPARCRSTRPSVRWPEPRGGPHQPGAGTATAVGVSAPSSCARP